MSWSEPQDPAAGSGREWGMADAEDTRRTSTAMLTGPQSPVSLCCRRESNTDG